MSCNALKLNHQDNIATALAVINKGSVVTVSCHMNRQQLTALEDIPFGFKISLCDIAQDDDIIKYGEIIGRASVAIKAGEKVHVHNVVGRRGRGDITENRYNE